MMHMHTGMPYFNVHALFFLIFIVEYLSQKTKHAKNYCIYFFTMKATIFGTHGIIMVEVTQVNTLRDIACISVGQFNLSQTFICL
jgi:hypothetical protein